MRIAPVTSPYRAQLWSPWPAGVRSPSQHVQSRQVTMVRVERTRATGRRAERRLRGAGHPVFCTEQSVPTAPTCSQVPTAHGGTRHCPTPSHPPGTTTAAGPQQPPLWRRETPLRTDAPSCIPRDALSSLGAKGALCPSTRPLVKEDVKQDRNQY